MITDHPNYGLLLADKMLAGGKAVADIYFKKNAKPDQVVIVGNPAFDALVNRNIEDDRRTIARHGIDPEKRIVVYATDALYVEQTNRIIQAISQAVKQLDNVILVVKVHPRESEEPYLVNADTIVLRDIELYPLLNCCELLVTGRSTVELEALVLAKKVVTVNLTGRPDVVPHARNRVITVRKYEDIAPTIQRSLRMNHVESEGANAFIANYVYKLDGKSAERAVTAIKCTMLREGKSERARPRRTYWDMFTDHYRSLALGGELENKEILQLLCHFLESHPDVPDIADVGCACGGLYQALRRAGFRGRYVGFDISEVNLQEARSLFPDGDFRWLDVTRASLPTKYDVVVSSEVLSHLPLIAHRQSIANIAASARKLALFSMKFRDLEGFEHAYSDRGASTLYAYPNFETTLQSVRSLSASQIRYHKRKAEWDFLAGTRYCDSVGNVIFEIERGS
jgi:SAM-dependent methyltransferase